jgi:excinuclease ABC subunit C
LHNVDGIGPKTVEKLLREFGSAERVRNASDPDLVKVIGPVAARKVREHFAAPESPLKVLQ